MSEVAAEIEWKQDSPYGWTHPAGWTIGRYIVSGVSHFMLWQGREHRGNFGSLEAAQAHYSTQGNK
ncbi:hypothetical protein A8H39_01305 [Paraburkholderia fungorum]|uniref:hypothetical protein n=1 Tax=Paraburkholderia fungorum TaxID=134537 RepID=UPI0004873F2B|nr:hypothetical protein [Paraburkholderia fungorum]PNE59812.1 hypothetical protein A8H39_01305 [Paraburkholderia fungorum]